MMRWLLCDAQTMRSRMRSTILAALIAAISATGAFADLLPNPPQRALEVRQVTGIVEGFAGSRLTLRDARTGASTTFELRGAGRCCRRRPRRGDTATVTEHVARTLADTIAVDRVLPDGETRIRVFARNLPAAPPPLAQGQGCWIADRDGESVELCFTSVSRGVALRYAADGALACAAPLRLDRPGGAESCRVSLADRPEQTLAVTRR